MERVAPNQYTWRMGSNDVGAPLAAVPRFFDLRGEGSDPVAELRASLGAHAPFIAPKFFYDPLGSRLFEAICELPEYTLTRAEQGIFDRFGEDIALLVGIDRPFLDLGAGNCEKAERLFGVFAPSQYIAVDIAADFLQERLGALALRHPGMAIVGLARGFHEFPAATRCRRGRSPHGLLSRVVDRQLRAGCGARLACPDARGVRRRRTPDPRR